MNNNIKEIEAYPLSDSDIQQYLPDVKIYMYSDLSNYSSIDELLPNPNSYLILLYQDSENTGHWTCILRQNKTIEFFDPYGKYPDTELRWVDNEIRENLGITGKFISNLFNKSKLKIVYNTAPYQHTGDSINTCGRHVVYRLLNRNLSLKDYHKHFKNETKKNNCNYDCVVSKKVNIS
jgi:hypothetical protein